MENNSLDKAIDYISNGEYKEALTILYDLSKTDENNPEIYKNIGLCEINLDNFASAASNFEKVISLDKEDVVSIFYLANCKNQMGNKDAAIALLQNVIKLRPDFVDSYKSLAMLYIEIGKLDEAALIMNMALNNENIELDYSIYYMAATCYMLKRDYTGAIENLKKALELNPEHIAVANSLATCYMNTQDYKNAAIVLKQAFESEPENSLTAYNLGVCYQVLEEYEAALEFFQIAYKLEPTITMLSGLAFCALKAQKYELAKNLYQNLTNAYPNNQEYRISYIEALEETGDYEAALENVDLVLALDPKNIALIKKKGAYERKLGRNEDSLATFQTLINRGKIDVELYYNLAYNYVDMGDFDKARDMFKKCIILEPQNPYAHKDLGVLYLKMNCYDWAVDEMTQAINLEDDVAEFHYSLGVSYMMLSQIEEAKRAFLRAAELEPDNPDCMAYLAYIYMLDRNFDESKALLTRALQLEPENFIAKNHSAKLYFRLAKYDVAREFLKDIIEKTRDDESKNMLGVCEMELGNFEEAMGIFYQLSLNYPENHILLTNLAKCEMKQGKRDMALEHLRRALMVYDDYEDALNLLEEINNAK